MRLNTSIEMDAKELIAYTYFASSKKGRKYIYDSSKLAGSYAAKQAGLTARTFLVEPAKGVARGALGRGVAAGAVRAAPPLALAVGYGIAVHSLGQTHIGQKMRKRELYRTIRSGL
jgi:hypothetical protein